MSGCLAYLTKITFFLPTEQQTRPVKGYIVFQCDIDELVLQVNKLLTQKVLSRNLENV